MPEQREPRKVRRRVVAVVIALVLVIVVGLAFRGGLVGEVAARFREGGPKGRLMELGRVEQLQSSFNETGGPPRLVLLLSPT